MRAVTPGDEIDPVHAEWNAVVAAIESAQRRLLSIVERMQIPPQWYAVLHELLHAPDYRMPMSQLARETSFTSGGFTKLADRMARSGLIDRRSSGGDRRVVYATLTRSGLLAARGAERAYVAALHADVLTELSLDQLHMLAALLAPLGERPYPAELEPEAADPDEHDRPTRPRIDPDAHLGNGSR